MGSFLYHGFLQSRGKILQCNFHLHLKAECFPMNIKKINYTIRNSCDVNFNGKVPKSLLEMGHLINCDADSPPNSKLIKIGLIGVPNSGKSSLINTLVGWKVSVASKKVHTTLKNTLAIQNHNETQMILTDSPGSITPSEFKRHNVGVKSHLIDPQRCFNEVDLIAVVHDVSNHYWRERIHPPVLKLLAMNPHIPCILVLNKTDCLKSKTILLHTTKSLTNGKLRNEPACEAEKTKLPLNDNQLRKKLLYADKALATTFTKSVRDPYYFDTKQPGYIGLKENVGENEDNKNYSYLLQKSSITVDDIVEGRVTLTEKQAVRFSKKNTFWPMFQDVFMVSAKTGHGVKQLERYFLSCAYSSPWVYNSKVSTNIDPFEMVKLKLRGKLMDKLPRKIPFLLKFDILDWNLNSSNLLNITVAVIAPKFSLSNVVRGINLKNIKNACAQELQDAFCCEINLQIEVLSDQPKPIPLWVTRLRASRKGSKLAVHRNLLNSLAKK